MISQSTISSCSTLGKLISCSIPSPTFKLSGLNFISPLSKAHCRSTTLVTLSLLVEITVTASHLLFSILAKISHPLFPSI
ncbi:MAG: hypothetical protein LBQ24_02610 [Candidatus Peribacteria bacterium]|nr:hypothetical protein [Candidatus Peribacteria bacterium]